MQASIHEFDPQTGAGSVLLDDGRRLAFSQQAFEHSRLRLARTGQRVSLDLVDGVVVALRLVGV